MIARAALPLLLAIFPSPMIAMALAQPAPAPRPYEVEWVYRVKYGHQDEWWRIFQKYQIAILDR